MKKIKKLAVMALTPLMLINVSSPTKASITSGRLNNNNVRVVRANSTGSNGFLEDYVDVSSNSSYFDRSDVTHRYKIDISGFGYKKDDVLKMTINMNEFSGFRALADTVDCLHLYTPSDGYYAYSVYDFPTQQVVMYVKLMGNTEEILIEAGYELQNQDRDELWSFFETKLFNVDITRMTVSNMAPIIDGKLTFINNINAPITAEFIKSKLTAIDDKDGDVTSNIKIEVDNYTANSLKIGSFNIIFSATDSSGNKTTVTVTVNNIDNIPPVISLNGEKKKLSDVVAEKVKFQHLLLSLNVSDVSEIESIKIKAGNVEIDSNDYVTFDFLKANDVITFLSRDVSGNESSLTINVKELITDDIAPEINGADEIVVSWNTLLSKDSILSKMTVTDKGFGLTDKLKIVGYENYESKSTEIGDYPVVIEATDSSGNKGVFDLTIKVRDNIPPIIYYDKTIFVEAENTLSTDNIVSIISDPDKKIRDYKVLADSYSFSSNKVGVYDFVANLNYDDETSETKTVAINVVDKFESEDLNLFEKIKQKIGRFFQSVWKMISGFFVKSWNWLCFKGWNE